MDFSSLISLFKNIKISSGIQSFSPRLIWFWPRRQKSLLRVIRAVSLCVPNVGTRGVLSIWRRRWGLPEIRILHHVGQSAVSGARVSPYYEVLLETLCWVRRWRWRWYILFLMFNQAIQLFNSHVHFWNFTIYLRKEAVCAAPVCRSVANWKCG